MFCVIVFLYWMALYLYVPTLPTYAQTKTSSLALVGTILAQYGLWQAIVRLPVGIASDWAGRRKPFILVGILLAGVGAYVMGSAGDSQQLLLGRAITGLAAATWVPLVVAFSSLFPPGEAVRASATLTLVGSLGRVLATAANGPLNNWAATRWRSRWRRSSPASHFWSRSPCLRRVCRQRRPRWGAWVDWPRVATSCCLRC